MSHLPEPEYDFEERRRLTDGGSYEERDPCSELVGMLKEKIRAGIAHENLDMNLRIWKPLPSSERE